MTDRRGGQRRTIFKAAPVAGLFGVLGLIGLIGWIATLVIAFQPGSGRAEYHPSGAAHSNGAQGLGHEITGRDGAVMVLVPSGSFWMGSTRAEVDLAIQDCRDSLGVEEKTCVGWYEDEMPRHKASLDAFYLDVHEVTNRLFAQFTAATGYLTTAEREGWAKAWVQGRGLVVVKGANWRQPEGSDTPILPHRDQHPVVSVSWEDATAYCLWAGKRLPTETEWEYAARAGTHTLFWWGDEEPHDRKVGNIADESARNLIGGIVQGYTDGFPRTSPIGSFEPNPWGLQGMIGNVAEWTQDWYGGSYKKEAEHNPQGPAIGQYKVIRGGSWANGPLRARSANRDWDTPIYRHDTVGFRCAMSLSK